MTSYWWIVLLGILMVTGVKMQEDGAEGDGNTETATEDTAPAEEKKSEDEPTPAGTEDSSQDSDDASPEAADGDGAADSPADTEEKTEETPTETPETATEDTTPGPEKKSEDEPTPAAKEEPAKEGGGEDDVPATTETETDLPTEKSPTETTEPVIIAVEGAGDTKNEEPTTVPAVTPEDDGVTEDEIEDSVQPVAGESKVRSAGSVSGPNVSGGGSGTVIGVVCGVAVAAVVAIVGYFTYQNKKLCFKAQRGDPESAREENGTQSDPQVSSNLLTSS
ncbi:uncharacterized protein [Paramisgurnus dabryanus]|uniref:uncharacterized protein isoform X2 n=1 Tax=Paramisgurnus dabryanus TaxID=90735 RepID=UPI0031F417E3